MKKSSFIYIVIAGILWGTSGVFYNLLKSFGFSSLQMTSMRGIVSAFSMIVYVLIHNKKLFRVSIKEFIIFACSGIAVFFTAVFYYAAIQYASVSVAAVLMYTAPAFVMIYSVTILGEKLTASKVVAVFLVIVGCALVSGIAGDIKFSFLGVLLGLAAGVSYSAYNIFTKIEMMNKYNSLSATLYCFIVMGIVSCFVGEPLQMLAIISKNPAPAIPLMIGIGVCTCVLPYFLYTLALKSIPVGTASAMAIIEPVSASIFSVIFFGERLGIASICGIFLILVAVIMLNRNDA